MWILIRFVDFTNYKEGRKFDVTALTAAAARKVRTKSYTEMCGRKFRSGSSGKILRILVTIGLGL